MLFVTAGLPGGDFVSQGRPVRDTPIQTLTGQNAEFGLSHVQPTSMLWRIMPLEPLNQPARLGGGKGFVERCRLVGVEVVLHEYDLPRGWKVDIGEIFQDPSIIPGRVAIGRLDMPPALLWGEDHEQIDRSIPLVFIIVPGGLPWLRRNWHTCFGSELASRFHPHRPRDTLDRAVFGKPPICPPWRLRTRRWHPAE